MEHDEVLIFAGDNSSILFKNPDFQIIDYSNMLRAEKLFFKNFILNYFEVCIKDLMGLFGMHNEKSRFAKEYFYYFNDVTNKFINFLRGEFSRDELIDFMIDRYISNLNIRSMFISNIKKNYTTFVADIETDLLESNKFYESMKKMIEKTMKEMQPRKNIEEEFSEFGIEYNNDVTLLQKDIIEELFYISVFKIESLTKSLIEIFYNKDISSIGGDAEFLKIKGGIINRDFVNNIYRKKKEKEEIKYYLDVIN